MRAIRRPSRWLKRCGRFRNSRALRRCGRRSATPGTTRCRSKRRSVIRYGLSFASTFTCSKNLAIGAPSNVVVPGTGGSPVNDVFNRNQNKYLSPQDQPFIFNLSLNYTLPALQLNRIVSSAVRDWTIGVFAQYASGLPIAAPAAQNNLNALLLRNGTSLSNANRVAGQPLFLKDHELSLLRSEQGIRPESGGLVGPCSGNLRHRRSLLWRLPGSTSAGRKLRLRT